MHVADGVAMPAQPPSLYRNLVEAIALLGSQVIYAQESGADNRSNAEIGEEILLAIMFPDISLALNRLREAELDRALESPRSSFRRAEEAIVLKLRRQR